MEILNLNVLREFILTRFTAFDTEVNKCPLLLCKTRNVAESLHKIANRMAQKVKNLQAFKK